MKEKKVNVPGGEYYSVKEETARKIKAHYRKLMYIMQQNCEVLLALLSEMMVTANNAGSGGSN